MKKLSILKISLAIIAIGSLGATASLIKRSESDNEVKATSTSFNITTENAMNANVIVLNVDKALSAKASAASIKWYVNDVEYVSWVQPFSEGDTTITLTWGDAGSASASNLSHYVHYYIPSETDFGGGYTLEKDYNFWWSHQSGGNSSLSWTFQNGGTDAVWNHAIPSIHIDSLVSGDSGAQDASSRFVVNFNITKEAGVYSVGSWNAANIMTSQGSNDYSLYDYSSSENNVFGMDGIMTEANKEETSGTWGLLIYYAGISVTAGDGVAHGFYIPKGTLYGGFNENYGFYVDNDVYFDWTGSKFEGNFSTSMKDRVYTPIADLVTKLHMDSSVEGQCTSYWAEAKTAYNALNEEAKGIFASQSDYTAAYARYNAWSIANPSGGSGLFGGVSETDSSEIIILYTLLAGIAIGSLVLAITLRKKKHS